jgi:hypothetical protein
MSQAYAILPTKEEAMISKCCTYPKPDLQELSDQERKEFCRLVYLLRKRGYSVADAQETAYRKILEESIPFERNQQSI